MRLPRISGTVIFALLLAGCAGNEAAVEDPSVDSQSPIEQFFAETAGVDYAIGEWRNALQEDIAVCMNEQGFEFKPGQELAASVGEIKRDLTAEEWAEQYGFGISTTLESSVRAQADANNQILLSLGAAEQAEYLKALYGEQVATGQVTEGSQLPPLDEQGCAGEATLENGGEAFNEGIQTFNEDLLSSYQQLLSEPTLVAAVDQWSACMKGRGYDFVNQDEAETMIQTELAEIMEPLNDSALAGGPEALTAFFAGDPDAAVEGVPEEFQLDDLVELQSTEREIAINDLACYNEFVKSTFEPLRATVEDDLISEHQDSLEKLRELSA